MELIPTCPNCLNGDVKSQIESSPYWGCPACDLWFQNPMPPKKFEADEEKGEDGRSKGHRQPPSDLAVAALLAEAYATRWVKKLVPIQEGRTSYKVLDIGAKYPFFVSKLRDALNGAEAYGLDAMDQDRPNAEPIAKQYEAELGIPMLLVDFEKVTTDQILAQTSDGTKFDSLSMIHVFEHIYDPVDGIMRLDSLLQPNGVILLRMPDNKVDGWRFHMSPQHYSIHPYFWSEKAFTKLIERTNRFKILESFAVGGGTRDYILCR